jgi:hypothetical protein
MLHYSFKCQLQLCPKRSFVNLWDPEAWAEPKLSFVHFYQVSTYTKGFTLIIEPSDDKTPNVVNPVSGF